MLCVIGLSRFRSFLAFSQTEDVWDDISRAGASTFRFQAQTDLNMRLAFGIWIEEQPEMITRK